VLRTRETEHCNKSKVGGAYVDIITSYVKRKPELEF